jgi:hypothetical protein
MMLGPGDINADAADYVYSPPDNPECDRCYDTGHEWWRWQDMTVSEDGKLIYPPCSNCQGGK